MSEPPPLVALEKATVSLGGKRVLHGLSWGWENGTHWLIVGDNGSGKSTFLKLLSGTLFPEKGGARRYCLGGECFEAAAGMNGQMVLMSPEKQLRHARLQAGQSVRAVILSGFSDRDYVFEKPTRAQRQRVERIARDLKIIPLMRRSTDTLSQGQLRRVLLARALVARPTLLLLDEYDHGLDAPSRALIHAALLRAKKQGTHLLSATHRSGEAGDWATHWLHLQNGKIRAFGKTPAPASLLGGVKKSVPKKSAKKSFGKTNMRPLVRIERANVSAQDLSKNIRLLHDINLCVNPGEHILLTGPNGAGKSTLVRLIYGDLTAARGACIERFLGARAPLFLPEARLRMGLLSANLHERFDPSQTLVQAVASGFAASLGLWRAHGGAQFAAARRKLKAWGLSKVMEKTLGEVSFGQARLALLARACIRRPKLLLLDEAFDGLSPDARVVLRRRLEKLAKEGVTILMSTHHGEDAPRLPLRPIEIKNGRLVREE